MGNTQHLEGIFSKTMKEKYPHLYCKKIHNNPLAHQQTDADFRVYSRLNRYLVECKEQKWTTKNPYEFARLQQEADLLRFNQHSPMSKSYVMIMYWCGSVKNSKTYLIPIRDYLYFKETWHKKSVNLDDAMEHWSEWEVEPVKGSMFDLDGRFP